MIVAFLNDSCVQILMWHHFIVLSRQHFWKTAAAASLQSCLTLCGPIDGSPAGSAVPGILQARTLEWVAISFSNAWKWKVKMKLLSHVRLFATPWTAAYQAPPSMGLSRQEYWSGVPSPSPFEKLENDITFLSNSVWLNLPLVPEKSTSLLPTPLPTPSPSQVRPHYLRFQTLTFSKLIFKLSSWNATR